MKKLPILILVFLTSSTLSFTRGIGGGASTGTGDGPGLYECVTQHASFYITHNYSFDPRDEKEERDNGLICGLEREAFLCLATYPDLKDTFKLAQKFCLGTIDEDQNPATGVGHDTA